MREVVIAGAGPVGLMLAGELALAQVDVVVFERALQPRTEPKANGLGGQVVSLLDYRGLLEQLREDSPYAGPAPGWQFGGRRPASGSLVIPTVSSPDSATCTCLTR